jgi:lysyl-tRNA synthetase class 2
VRGSCARPERERSAGSMAPWFRRRAHPSIIRSPMEQVPTPTTDATPPGSEYEQERRHKRDQLRALGVDPYGRAETDVRPLAAVKAMYADTMGADGGPTVKVAGRVMFCKRFGKLSFMTLRDETGDLQIAADKKRLSERDFAAHDLVDLGDQIVVEGALGRTRTGEVTVWARSLAFAAKSLLPPPGKYSGLEDIEVRYRQRYVDLWANPAVMRQLRLRSAVVAEVRAYLTNLGYVEVETPMMQPIAGGAAARPFTTHHNALDIPLYLRIAPELYLKRLLVGGFTKVFELNRNFRNEGISPRHNPEFTMLEAYEAFGSWETMADLVEGMVCHIAEKLFGGLKIVHGEGTEARREINLTRPWRRVSMVDLVAERTERLGCRWDFDKRPMQVAAPELLDILTAELRIGGKPVIIYDEPGVHPDEAGRAARLATDPRSSAPTAKVFGRLATMSPPEQLVEVYEKLIEPTLIDPTYVTHVPSVIIPLAKKNGADPFFADVYELAINGQEISPGYSELNDPDVQSANFAQQVGDAAERQQTDDDFLTALKYGMPPAGGLGLGIDRLVMMLTGAESIRDVILFPLMRPQS